MNTLEAGLLVMLLVSVVTNGLQALGWFGKERYKKTRPLAESQIANLDVDTAGKRFELDVKRGSFVEKKVAEALQMKLENTEDSLGNQVSLLAGLLGAASAETTSLLLQLRQVGADNQFCEDTLKGARLTLATAWSMALGQPDWEGEVREWFEECGGFMGVDQAAVERLAEAVLSKDGDDWDPLDLVW